MMNTKNIYIVGIEGAGTSTLAALYAQDGHNVSGSDEGDGFYRETLTKAGIDVHTKFSTNNIPEDLDFAVHSTAYDASHSEVEELQKRNVRLLSYPEALGEYAKQKYTYAVCGTHGKTTTTGFLTHALIGAGEDPSALVGASVVGWQGGMRVGNGAVFVMEADEYQDKLALYSPQVVVLTSCDFDHPDFFPDSAAYKETFERFVARIPDEGFLVYNGDDSDVAEIAQSATCATLSYGTADHMDCCIVDRVIHAEGGQRITVQYDNKKHTIETLLYGPHNAANAVGAWLATTAATKRAEDASRGIAEFKGVIRRFESKGVYNGAVLIDDYAHHPEELRVAIATARETFPERRLIVAFHPHTFSRTAALKENFARALEITDKALILDIYGSEREESGGIHAQDLVDAINDGMPGKAEYHATIDDVATWAKKCLSENDIFLTCGAGDVYHVHDQLTKTL